jgi:hypothetical protein
MSIEKTCQNCNKSLVGRSDKKFCDESCRNQYNNTLNSDISTEMRAIQNVLRRNRRILEEILGDNEKTKVSLKKLTDLGYKLDYLTQLYTTKTGSQYRYCFEYGLMILEENMVLIVKKGR